MVNRNIFKRSFIVILIFIFIFLLIVGCIPPVVEQENAVVVKKDYTYQEVPGDPLKARIYTLDNGLKIYTTVYKDEPRIQTAIAVKAGGKTDPDDATGMAHYLEHMLFKGTDEFGTLNWEKEKVEIDKIIALYDIYGQTTDSLERKAIYQQIDSVSQVASTYAIANEYDKMLSAIGATGTNAFTSVEQTVYINDIPTNQFTRWLKIAYERFSDPVMRLFHTELEVVYEEKNRSLDSDGTKVYHALHAGLFQKHPYGTHTILGTVEHLKNPPLFKVIEYIETYYVPNNMAICLSGDFDPEVIIPLIDATFGQMPAKPIPEFVPPVEDPISEPRVIEVLGPEAESVQLAFRFPGINSKETDLLIMTDMILMNSSAGLIDLNLNQAQKVIGAYSYPQRMADYSYHGLGARPREGQSLEEVKDLLLEQINLIKQGEFPDWLPAAVITDLKLGRIRRQESNRSRAMTFMSAFTTDTPWERVVNEMDRLAQITKADIVEFANQYYSDNYVVVYKRTGEDKGVAKITKPEITPVDLNRTDQSVFMSDVLALDVPDVNPVFLDFKEDIDQLVLNNDIPVYYRQNTENGLFSLYYLAEMGTDHDRRLGIALRYLEYLGTSRYSPEQVKEEFYKLGIDFNVFSSNDRVWVMLDGLVENFDAGLNLFEHLLADAQPNPEALENLVQDIQKQRSDNKLSKGRIRQAMSNYGKYGPESSATNVLSESELQVLSPAELVEILHQITDYEHLVLYYGPDDSTALINKLNSGHKIPPDFLAIPEPVVFGEADNDQTKVFVVNYDMVQAEITLLSKSVPFNPDNVTIRALFNEYYGGNMSSVVFQTLRESKALAYAVYAYYGTPSRPDKSHYITGYIGTQADKLPEALEGFFDLLTDMPESEKAFTASKDGIINRIKPERITKEAILFRYLSAQRMGIDHDIRKDLFNQIPDMTMADVNAFFEEFIQGQRYNIMVLADTTKIDLDALVEYGEVTFLSLEEIFGY
ncbi:MAG: insulinase family protein [Candidatus Marinimicrobia bacterium]|nr:insulinase family protein [Candidatus Neomarinimicrobiota bacterium]